MTALDLHTPEWESSHPPGVLPARRRAGVCLHFSALPSPHGIGDIGDASLAFVDELRAMDLHVWQFLPTGPTAYGDSPYQPLSAFAGNENLIGLDELIRLGLLPPDAGQSLASLPEDTVDFGRLIPGKKALLNAAATHFAQRAAPELRAAYEQFLHRHQDRWLQDYALFRVLKELHDEQAWPQWAPEYVHRKASALERIAVNHADQLERIKIQQFFFDRQWQALRAYAGDREIRLFGDIPIYIALDSSDAWAKPELLKIHRDGQPSHVAGVPPDYFSEDGQLWGNPLYDWSGQAQTGFGWWVERMRDATEKCDMLRVDHFRGFESYWSVPWGESTARNGTWEPGPGDALFEAMERALGSLPIVAEDLGFITPEVHELRLRHRIPGMKVLQFEVEDPDFRFEDIADECVCYTGTHDNDTTAGWFAGGSDDVRTPEQLAAAQESALRWSGGRPETIAQDMIRWCFSSNARVALAPMQDFLGLGSEARVNIPGTTMNNWRWRLEPGQLNAALRDQVRDLVAGASRQ